MFFEYKPDFYVNFNAECNNTYVAENANNHEAVKQTDGSFLIPSKNALIKTDVESFPGCGAYRQRTTLTNMGGAPITVDMLSAAFISGIGADGAKRWNENRFILHYADTAWQGEAQWKHVPLTSAGLYKTYNHHSQTSAVFSGIGSWSTSKYEPFVMLEDTELKKTWYFAIATGSSWYIGLFASGQREDSSVCVFISDCCEKNDGWYKELAPGESYTTADATVGCVDGGFEAAIADFTQMRRASHLCPLPGGIMPLCFNDYMNCLWALPTREKLIPLIDAAAAVGCEYFVIDAGWFGKTTNWDNDLGDWQKNDSLFGDGGFGGIVDYIRSKGMNPGCWLEIESAGAGSDFVKAHPGCVLRRRGHAIGGGRVFLDYTKPEVRTHIASVFDTLYALGIRFIKNDYNQSVGIGCDADGECLPVGLRRQHLAVMEFIDGIRAKYPDLVIENCGSGAMRSDHGTLSHFAMQSVSDQEDYIRMPSVVSGSLACVAPERLGVWAYPYPVAIDYRETFRPTPEFSAQFADGYITEFNMVTALMGSIYLSGHIDCADDFNLALIREAADIYKKNRKTVAGAVPVYPNGTFDMQFGGVGTFGLLNKAENKLLLAVWSLSDDAFSADIDLSAYAKELKPAGYYPKAFADCVKVSGTRVSVGFKAPKTAVYVEFDVKR